MNQDNLGTNPLVVHLIADAFLKNEFHCPKAQALA